MKKLFTGILGLLLTSLTFAQSDFKIVERSTGLDCTSGEVTITGTEGEIGDFFDVYNMGNESIRIGYGRTVLNQTNPSHLIQLCDADDGEEPGVCYNTAINGDDAWWQSPVFVDVPADGSTYVKLQISTGFPGGDGTALVRYYIIDEDANKLDSVTVNFIASTASITQPTKIAFSVYPNPAQDVVTITGEGFNNGGTVVFVDALGKEVKRSYVKESGAKINVSELKRGVYFIHLYNKEGIKSSTQRIVKQ